MSTQSSSRRGALRALVVIGLFLVIICFVGADIRRLWLPLGKLGYGTNSDGVVTGIDANSPAEKAGIQLGDRVDVHLTPPQYRWFVVQQTWWSEPGKNVTLTSCIRTSIVRSRLPLPQNP